MGDGRRPDTRLSIDLLGRFAVRVGERVVLDDTWPRTKAKAILKLIALQPDRQMQRDQVLDLIWPDLDPEAAANNLRKNLSLLRSKLAEQDVALPIARSREGVLSLGRDVLVDLDELRERVDSIHSCECSAEEREAATNVYVGQFLPQDAYEDWARECRANTLSLQFTLLQGLCEHARNAGEHDIAERAVRRILDLDPLREDAHRALMRLYAGQGNLGAAANQYWRCRTVLRDELDIEPSEETQRLWQEIEAGSPAQSMMSGQLTVLESRSGPEAPFARPGSFVGREEELSELRSLFNEAIGGRARLALVLGEPGIGKTTLSEIFADEARALRGTVVWGRCHETEGAPPYWPWTQVLREYIGSVDPDLLRSELGATGAFIAQLVPELKQLVPGIPGVRLAQPEQAQFHLFDSVTTFLKNAARRRPMVVILDDLHWADEASLRLLQYLGRNLSGSRLLVLATYRHTELTAQHPLTQTLGELPVGPRLELRGLSPQEVGRYVEIVAGVSPAEPVLEAVYRQTEGNPFFVGEFVRLMRAEGLLQDGDSGGADIYLPQGVREVIARRLSRLSQRCHDLLSIASVIGREFDRGILARIGALGQTDTLRVLEEAIDACVVDVVSGSGRRYTFAHALIREVLYDDVDVRRRGELHEQIGAALESLRGEWAPSPAELAYHFCQAASAGGDAKKAVEFAGRAGRAALDMLAYEDAVRHYRTALGVEELHLHDQRARCELLLSLGEAYWKTSDVATAKDCYLSAAEAARQCSNPELLAQVALVFGGIWDVPGEIDDQIIGLLKESLHALGMDTKPRALVLARLARAYGHTGHDDDVSAWSGEALAIARRIGEPDVLAPVLAARYIALWGADNAQRQLEVATALVRTTEELGDRERVAQAHAYMFLSLLQLGKFEAYEREFEETVRLMEDLKQPYYDWHISRWRAMRALMEGRLQDAEAEAVSALKTGHDVTREALMLFGLQIGTIRWAQKRQDETIGSDMARWAGDAADAEPSGSGQDASALARVGHAVGLCELGRLDEARKHFDILARNDFDNIARDGTWLICMADLVQVCEFLRDPRAAILYDLMKPYEGMLAATGTGSICFGSVHNALGQLATVLHDWDLAEEHFLKSLDVNGRLGARLFYTNSQIGYARVLGRRCRGDDLEIGRELLDDALRTCRELELTGVEGKALRVKGRLDLAEVG